jgi:hypothetical protein
MHTFTKTFEIAVAIGWELHKSNLAEALFDRTEADSDCPKEIIGSVYTGEVQVKDKVFVVYLTEGEKS